MKSRSLAIWMIVLTVLSVCFAGFADAIATAAALSEEGNYRDAYEIYRKLALVPGISDAKRAEYFRNGVSALLKVGLYADYDSFVAEVTAAGGKQPLTALALAASILNPQLPGYGQTVGGVFTRGPARGGIVYSSERDRVRALQLLLGVKPLLGNLSGAQRAEFFLTLADVLLDGRNDGYSWRLQRLTDIERLPEYGTARPEYSAPPVNPDGSPVLYRVPANFESAGNDGQRWRWALAQAEEAGDVYNVKMRLADFLSGQFCGNALYPDSRGDGANVSLGDRDFYAMLATGYRRFTLPDAQNPILIYKSLYSFNHPESFAKLCRIYRARERYRDAVEVLKKWLAANGDAADPGLTAEYQELTGYSGRFEYIRTFGAGKKPVVTFNYRNAPEVDLVLRPFALERFLEMTEKELREQKYLDTFHDFLSFRKIMTAEEKDQFLGSTIDQWMVKLEPGTEYRPQKMEMTLPVTRPGIYLLTGVIAGAEEIRELVCVSEYTLEVRELKNSVMCFVADAATGKPVKGRKIRFWGCMTDRSRKPVSRLIDEFEVWTDAQGMVVIPREKFREHFAYVIHVLDENGKSSYAIALRYFYLPRPVPQEGRNLKIFGISNQPVYKPGDTVNFQFWLRDLEQAGNKPKVYSEQEAEVTVSTARGSEIWKKSLKTDSAGMLWGSFQLPDEVELGWASIRVVFRGAGLPENLSRALNFRVEEYRKPEFEVQVTPSKEIVAGGEKFEVTVKGEYYFGGPVRGTVDYRVSRLPAFRPLFRYRDFSWLYDDAAETPWRGQGELLMNGMGELGEDGTFKLTVDTAGGRAVEPGQDYYYQITAEVTDITRRSVGGSKSVLAAAAPYRAEIEMNKGFYRAGEEAAASIMLFDAARKPASGQAEIALFALSYDAERKAIETRLRDWGVLKIDGGILNHPFKFGNPGIYRIRVQLKAGDKSESVQAYRDVVVLGKEGEKVDYQFGPLTIYADRALYQPGDTAELLITSGVKDGTVLWFERLDRGGQPELIALENGMAVRKVKLTELDQPNIFVEAEMIHGGERARTTCELRIPPVRKILNVELAPAKPSFEPGSEASLSLKVTDAQGKGVKGIFTLTVYDEALEYINGGSNVADVRKLFWGNTRSLEYYNNFFNMAEVEDGLGVFGISAGGMRLEVARDASANKALDAAPGNADYSAEAVLRSNFRDSAVWRCAVLTNENGESTIPVPLPDDITRWRGRVWVIDDANAVGQGKTGFTAKKDLFVRLIMPRFLVNGDHARIMEVVHNSTGEHSIRAELSAAADRVKVLDPQSKNLTMTGAQVRASWAVKAVKSGTADILAKVAAGSRGDALTQKLPVLDYGLPQLRSIAGLIAADNTESIFVPLEFPDRIAPGSAAVEIKLATSPASAIVELLPRLIGSERRDLYALAGRLQALIAARRFVRFNIETGLIHKIPPEYSMVYDETEFNRIVLDTLKNLSDYQNPDGGWGWFSGYYEVSSPDTTAYAVAALAAAAKAGFNIDTKSYEQGVAWLAAYAGRDRDKMDPNIAASVNYALTVSGKGIAEFNDFVYARRDRLTLYHLALLGLSCTGEQQQMVLRNLKQFLVGNPVNFTARLAAEGERLPRFGAGSELEANAAFLRLLLRTEPKSTVLPRLAKYVEENRRHSLEETALRQNTACVEALNEYLASLAPGKITADAEVRLDGKTIEKVTLDGNIMLPPRTIRVDGKLLSERRHSLEFRRSGEGPLYFTVNQECYNQDRKIASQGTDLQLKRFYWRLQSAGDDQYRRVALKSGDTLKPGDLVEVELALNTAYDFRYLMIEDRRPAGLEPLDPISGYSTGYPGTYIETRNTATRFYIKNSGIGISSWSYRMKAETEGVFAALPATAVTLYTPGIQGNTAEFSFTIGSKP